MSDNNSAQKVSNKSQDYFLPGFLFALLGIGLHSLFFIGTLACLILVQNTRQHRMIAGIVSVVLLVVAFGYSLGKDLAVRDNALDAKSALSAEKTP